VRYRITWRGDMWRFTHVAQYRYRWWPFWFDIDLATDVDHAKALIEKHKNRHLEVFP